MSKKPVILFVAGKHNGCNHYRIVQPAEKIIEKDIFPSILSSNLNETELAQALNMADIIVTQSHSPSFLDFIMNEKGNKKIVFDYDDNIFDVSIYNPSYQFHGLREVDINLPDGQKIEIRDGKDGFDIERNRKTLNLFREVLRSADMVTTPSPVLSGIFKQFNKNVRVIKNYIDFNIWTPLNLRKDGMVRIGYQGGWSHFEDFLEVKDALKDVMEKHKNTILIIMGQVYEGPLKDLPQDRIRRESWVPVDVYPWKFKTLNIDIGIAPLANTTFNTAKSELKWEEYSALEIPCVSSNIPPYSLNISHNETGLLASNRDEWFEYLEKLVVSSESRKTIARQALKDVFRKYDLDTQIANYEEAYTSLFRKELILV